MTVRRSRPKPPELPPVPGGLLDWRASAHWSQTAAQCRYCPETTQLRDAYGRPSHKTCAEEAARRWTAATTPQQTDGRTHL
ncbi:hypothetical protein OIE91_11495 [Streptomyces albidoflavus]|uniref:hypothetical protein n=1 Tax=Streptomyces albidoflavus TaxID=1886 RepID=UPI00352E4E9C